MKKRLEKRKVITTRSTRLREEIDVWEIFGCLVWSRLWVGEVRDTKKKRGNGCQGVQKRQGKKDENHKRRV